MRWLLPGLVLLLAACGSGENPLADTEWRLVALGDDGAPAAVLFRQEQRMQDSLATVERFEVSGERLTLHSEGGQVLVFERVGE